MLKMTTFFSSSNVYSNFGTPLHIFATNRHQKFSLQRWFFHLIELNWDYELGTGYNEDQKSLKTIQKDSGLQM